MKWITDYKHPDNIWFAIWEDPKAGFYFYAWPDGEPFDDLQDTFEFAKNSAQRNFDVPEDSWRAVDTFPENIASLFPPDYFSKE